MESLLSFLGRSPRQTDQGPRPGWQEESPFGPHSLTRPSARSRRVTLSLHRATRCPRASTQSHAGPQGRGAGRFSYQPCLPSCSGLGPGLEAGRSHRHRLGTSAADHPAASMSKHVPGSSSVLHSTTLPGLCLGPATMPEAEDTAGPGQREALFPQRSDPNGRDRQ